MLCLMKLSPVCQMANGCICHSYLSSCRKQTWFKQPFFISDMICVDGSKRGLTTSKTTLRHFLSDAGNPQRHRQDNRANVLNCTDAVPLSVPVFFSLPH